MSDFFDKEISQMFLNLSTAMMRSITYSMSAAEKISKELGEGNSELKPYFAMLKRDQSRLMRIASNLSVLGNIGLGYKQHVRRLVDVCKLCTELADTVSVLAGENGISVTCVCKASAATVASYGDIETLLLNMLSNSLLRCREGDEINIAVSRTENNIVITISDTGVGVSPEVLPTLFNDYARAEDFSDPFRGAGLGVSVAESLAKFYGGSLVISPRDDHGTIATITLPTAPGNILGKPQEIYNKSMRSVLIGLSDFLDSRFFMPPFY